MVSRIFALERMREHRQRMLESAHPDRDAIRELFEDDALESMALLVAPKMQQSQTYGAPHSTFLLENGAAMALMTFPGTVEDAAE